MPHPHAHNLTALVAVAEFALLHELPLYSIGLPGSPFAAADAITIDLPRGVEGFNRWVEALDIEPLGPEITVVPRTSVLDPDTLYETGVLAATLHSGVRVQVRGTWAV